MLPNAYEFHWDLGHVIFLGVFYAVATTVLVGLMCAARSWWRDMRRRRAAAIEWEETFHDLPSERRHCRHEFDGTFDRRICEHGFDCATCQRHAELTAARSATGSVGPRGRLYHRGHTWVQPIPDGSLAVGLDDFARQCFGEPDNLVLPEPGDELVAGERAVVVERGGLQARIPAPVSGRVVALGPETVPWLYRVEPAGTPGEKENLLRGEEAEVWLLREKEWLQKTLNPAGGMPLMADGGEVVDDLPAAYPQADWDGIWGQVCLDS